MTIRSKSNYEAGISLEKEKHNYSDSKNNTFLLVTGNFGRDLKNPKLSHDELSKMQNYLEKVMWEKIHIEKIEQNWR